MLRLHVEVRIQDPHFCDEANRQACALIGRAAERNGLPLTALAHLDLAVLLHEWDDLPKSEPHLKTTIDLCLRGKQKGVLAACRMMEARLRLAQGDAAAANQALDAG